MIFITVGSQMPFDRLIIAVDKWVAGNYQGDVLGQIGDSILKPENVKYVSSLTPAQFVAQVSACDLVVAHAGMGSILTALEYGKPLVLLARRGDLMETRNDHQIATAKWLGLRPEIFVAQSEDDIGRCIEAGLASARAASSLGGAQGIDRSASPRLINAFKTFFEKV